MVLPMEAKEFMKSLFEKYLLCPVEIVLTNNKCSVLSAKKVNGIYKIRLSKCFLGAGEGIIKGLAFFLLKKKKITEEVKEYLECSISHRRTKEVKIEVKGRVYDLKEIFDELNDLYFGGALNSRITWGKRVRKKGVRTRVLGTYNSNEDLIRINAILDSDKVPRFYLEYIVYHEMLHAFLGTKKANKRRIIHSKRFKELEKKFIHYEKALAWEKENRLSSILRA